MKRPLFVLMLVTSMILSSLAPVFAQDSQDGQHKVYLPAVSSGSVNNNSATEVQAPAGAIVGSTGDRTHAQSLMLSGLKLDEPIVRDGVTRASLRKLSPTLLGANGKVEVIVRLTSPSVGESIASGSVNASSADAQNAVSAAAASQQADVISAAQSLDGSAKTLARVTKVLNAVAMRIDAASIPALAANPNVKSIKPVVNYELDLSETVPYIGGTAVHESGFDGSGIDVAVLDSGIDYTHVAFGGAGTAEAYTAAYGEGTADPRNTTRDGLFPTAKVVEGYDFVGEVWPNGDLAPDDDPIDCGIDGIPNDEAGCDGGHGSHVADIIAGAGGVAPGANLHAVKVCSAVSTSCSGVAILQGLEYAVDPNGDGDSDDHVDVVNLSLGSVYGQAYDSDDAVLADIVSSFGVLIVASAGNSADKPYVTGTPAAAPSALSVAQTEVPSSKLPLMRVVSPESIAGLYQATYQVWSAPFNSVIEGSVQYGVDTNKLGCDAFPDGSLAGKIALLDRGTCAISIKVSNGAAAGAIAVLVGLVAPGDPTGFSYGGGDPTVPGFNISQATASKIKANLDSGVTVRFDPADEIPLVGHMVGSSSRGPSISYNTIKPEIGAPGASVSAIAGTGSGTDAFGGTSGAAPMVSGSAALLIQAKPGLTPAEYKALLVNTGETNIMNTPAFFGGYLAPITRIGGGEVRVNKAVGAQAAAWDADSSQPTLSFGFQDITESETTFQRTVRVRNYTSRDIIYRVQYFFRYMNDEAMGGVSFKVPQFVTVPANGDATFPIELKVNGTALRNWSLTNNPNSPALSTMNSGPDGGNPEPLTLMEIDGYIKLGEPGKPNNVLRMPWHILPRRSADTALTVDAENVNLTNSGVGTAYVETYSLIGKSDNLPEGELGTNSPQPDLRYAGVNTYPVPAGFCSANPSFIMAFAINTWERQTHANAPASFEIDIDSNQDGDVDYAVFNWDLTYSSAQNLSDGRNVVWVYNVATSSLSALFFTSHETNSGNTVLYICGEQIGMNAANFFDPMDISVLAVDLYFTGNVTDFIEGITISPLGEQYLGNFKVPGSASYGDFFTDTNTWVPSGQTVKMKLLDFGPVTNNTETGLLLLYRNGAPEGQEAAIVEVAAE